MKPEFLILVDEADNEIGISEKMYAHRYGKLHRAVSVLVFNSKNEMLLQKRAASKYHSPILWTNTCCTHPKPGEKTLDAAMRRLQQEMGISTPLSPIFSFIYKSQFNNGLTEHEYDHVFVGYTDNIPLPDHDEVSDWRYFGLMELQNSIANNPAIYTTWFKIIFDELMAKHIDKVKWPL